MTKPEQDGLMPRADLLELPEGGVGPRHLIVGFALIFAFWHILTNVYLTEPGLWQNAIHFAGFAFLASVTVSPWGSRSNQTWAWLVDVVYGQELKLTLGSRRLGLPSRRFRRGIANSTPRGQLW